MLTEWVISLLLAQNGVPAPANHPMSARAEELLRAWEGKRDRVQEARWEFEQTIEDHSFGTNVVEKGKAAGVRQRLLRVDWAKPDGAPKEILLYHDEQVDWFDFGLKTELALSLNPPRQPQELKNKGWWANIQTKLEDDLALRLRFLRDLFWGIPVEQIKSQFHVQLIKEDARWAYFRLEPRKETKRTIVPEAKEIQLIIDTKSGREWHVRVPEIGGKIITFRITQRETAGREPVTFELLSTDLPKDFKRIDERVPGK